MNMTNFNMTSQYSFIKSSIFSALYKWLKDVKSDLDPLTDFTFILQALTQCHLSVDNILCWLLET